jgi:nucleotide-binding universal stress UspA family protein
MKTILVPVDFSRGSRRVTAAAVQLARAVGARLVLLHAVPPPPVIATDVAPLAAPTLLVMDDAQDAAGRELRKLQRRLTTREVPVETICPKGFPVRQIISHARKVSADYIVIGSHGHTAVFEVVVGSTTRGVLKRAACPVVVVPSPRKKSGMHRTTRPAKSGRAARSPATGKRKRPRARAGSAAGRR